jgi:RHS repeat-associated protein
MNNNELHKKLLGDRASTSLSTSLGSSSVTTDANGVKTASALYKAFGETRYTLGNLGTDYHFTGQRNEAALGIYYFNARWYDGSLGRFLSPDSIVPTGTQGTQAWDRYAFVNNNPVRYTDPTGHFLDSLNTFTLSVPVITFGVKIGGFGPSFNGGLTWAFDLRPTKNFVSYLQNNPDLTKLPDQFSNFLTDQNFGLLVSGSIPAGIEAEGSITIQPGVTTQTIEELAGLGGDVAGKVNASGSLCPGGFCVGLEGSLDQSGDLQSVSLILGPGEGGHLTTDVVSYQEWVFWTDLDGHSCSNVAGVEGTGECPQ